MRNHLAPCIGLAQNVRHVSVRMEETNIRNLHYSIIET